MLNAKLPQVWMVLHGETEWTLAGRRSSRTDVPLTPTGEQVARNFAPHLRQVSFGAVWSSPLQRTLRTCELAGFASQCVSSPELAEWDFGDLEGLTSSEAQVRLPGWDIFRDGCPNGESVAEVTARADTLITKLRQVDGSVLLFSGTHFSRALAVRWTGQPVEAASGMPLDAVSALGYGRDLGDPMVARSVSS